MALVLSPWLWLAGFVVWIIAVDQNVSDYLAIKWKHLGVWVETQFMKAHLMAEIKAIENDKHRYDDIATELLSELQQKHQHLWRQDTDTHSDDDRS